MVAVDVPSRGTVTVASSKEPYLGLEIELDFAIMQEVAEEIEIGAHCIQQTESRWRIRFRAQ